MSKPVVHYTKIEGPLEVGLPAHVITVDHPDTVRITNGAWVRTSTVLDVGSDGAFETRNTKYERIADAQDN